MSQPLRIVVVSRDEPLDADPSPDAAELDERDRALRIGLLDAGYRIVAVLPPDAFLAERVRQLRPDAVVVDARSDARDAVEHVVLATRDDPRPIVLFTEVDDAQLARDAIAGGVTAYVVRGLQADRVRAILEVAHARFAREQALRAELDEARGRLAERKTIERAKGLLMQRHGIDEAEAWRRLRKAAMDRGRRIADVARGLVDAADLLG